MRHLGLRVYLSALALFVSSLFGRSAGSHSGHQSRE